MTDPDEKSWVDATRLPSKVGRYEIRPRPAEGMKLADARVRVQADFDLPQFEAAVDAWAADDEDGRDAIGIDVIREAMVDCTSLYVTFDGATRGEDEGFPLESIVIAAYREL